MKYFSHLVSVVIEYFLLHNFLGKMVYYQQNNIGKSVHSIFVMNEYEMLTRIFLMSSMLNEILQLNEEKY